MREDLPQRNVWLPRSVCRDPPGFQITVHIFIEVEPVLLSESHQTQSEDRLADRAGLKDRLFCHRFWAVQFSDTEASRPLDAPVVNDSNADSWRVVVGHALRKGGRWTEPVPESGLGQQATKNVLDAGVGAAVYERSKYCHREQHCDQHDSSSIRMLMRTSPH